MKRSRNEQTEKISLFMLLSCVLFLVVPLGILAYGIVGSELEYIGYGFVGFPFMIGGLSIIRKEIDNNKNIGKGDEHGYKRTRNV